MSFRIYEPSYAFIDARLSAVLDVRTASVMAEVEGPLRTALVLYIVLYGYGVFRGAISAPVMDLLIRAVKLVFLYALAVTPAYGAYIAEPLFTGLPNVLARALGGAETANVGAGFDQFLAYAAWLGDSIGREASLFDPIPLVVAAGVLLAGALATALGFGVVMIAKIALALLVALGPIFIACALFNSTRRFFFGWLSQAVNYLVLFALILAVFQLVLGLVRDQWDAVQGQDPIVAGLMFIALTLLGAIFFLQTPAIAAGVAGGASAGLADFASASGLQGRSAPLSPQGASRAPPASGRSLRPYGVRS